LLSHAHSSFSFLKRNPPTTDLLAPRSLRYWLAVGPVASEKAWPGTVAIGSAFGYDPVIRNASLEDCPKMGQGFDMCEQEGIEMNLSSLEALYVVFGIVCLGVAAVMFAMWQSLETQKGVGTTPNIVAAGASCGFAIAGGLGFVAAAIVHRSESHKD
jgi:hypothetical protein